LCGRRRCDGHQCERRETRTGKHRSHDKPPFSRKLN
jgi:hypothetical protein